MGICELVESLNALQHQLDGMGKRDSKRDGTYDGGFSDGMAAAYGLCAKWLEEIIDRV